jgi:replicative DNA helicase
MQAFKESGAIEYSTDVLIGLQLMGVGDKNFDVDTAKSKNPREVEAIILKNRNGRTGGKIGYNFHAMFNYFSETGEMNTTDSGDKTKKNKNIELILKNNFSDTNRL